jgi:hypothetical protein
MVCSIAMATFTIEASVTSPPTNVSLTINKTKIKMARDGAGAWAGKGDSIELPESFGFAFAAVGLPNAKWTLAITVSKADGTEVAGFTHSDKIPSNMLSSFHDTITLKADGQ